MYEEQKEAQHTGGLTECSWSERIKEDLCQQHVHQPRCFDIVLLDKRKLGDPKQLRTRYLQGVEVGDHHVSEDETSVLLWSLRLSLLLK